MKLIKWYECVSFNGFWYCFKACVCVYEIIFGLLFSVLGFPFFIIGLFKNDCNEK